MEALHLTGVLFFEGLRARLENLFLTCKKDAVGLLIALELWHGDDLAGFGIFHCTYVNMKMTKTSIYGLIKDVINLFFWIARVFPSFISSLISKEETRSLCFYFQVIS
jgi:hypothetical protein